MMKVSMFKLESFPTFGRFVRKAKVAKTVEVTMKAERFTAVGTASAGTVQRGRDDARARELMKIFSDAEPVVAQGHFGRRTIR